MSIRMSCPSCEEEVVVNDSQAGKKIRCKECGEVFAVKKGTSSRGGGISNSLANGGSKAAGGPLRGFPREEDEEEDRPRSRRRKSASPATMWIVIGSCGGGAFLLTIILVIVLNSGSDKPADDSGPVVEINDPRGRVRVKIPDNVPKDFAKDFAKDFEKPKVEDADPITRAINDLGGNVFSQGDAARNLERMSVNEARRAEVVAALKKVIDTREALIPRAECVKALAVWGTRADSTYLMNLLDDQDGAVKNSAMRALGKLKEDRAASILAGRLSDFFQRGEASQALKDIGPGAEAAVRQQLQNQDGGVRAEACRILKVIGTAASHAALIEACEDQEGGVAQAAREALPEAQRPPIYGPNQTLTLNVHVVGIQAWPAIEARIKALADVPKAVCKVRTSGDYKWVTLAPVKDPEAFSRRVNFGKVTALHKDQRLIYVESGQ